MSKLKKFFWILKSMSSKKLLITLVISLLLIHFSIFIFYPLLFGIFASFNNWSPIMDTMEFTGFKNYIKMFNDKSFIKSLSNTFYFAAVTMTFRIIIGLLLAVLINSVNRFKSFFRIVYFMPVVVSLFASSIVWKWFYDPVFGIFNSVLNFFGLEGLRWLNDINLAMPSVILMNIWKDYGFAMVIFLAGLSGIPRVYIEASQIDGANRMQTFWHIIFPLLKPTIAFVVVVSMVQYLQAFVQIYIMTRGGPANATATVNYKIFLEAFQKYQYGYALSISVILFLITMILAFIQIKLMRIKWRY